MNFETHKLVLLTGAGFTHNFGGFLTKQMWEHIFNQPMVQQLPNLRKALLNRKNKFNYEDIYEFLQKRGGENLKAYIRALDKVYTDIDMLVLKSKRQDLHKIGLNDLRTWLNNFKGSQKKKGFVFTLNHDLCLERHASSNSFLPYLPGAPKAAQCLELQKFEEIGKAVLPKDINSEGVDDTLQELNLIKLHGSCNWRDHNGNSILVIGRTKTKAIADEPLLNYYKDLFRTVLQMHGMHLWTIGYGFGDKHINDILADSIINHGLSLYIINPQRPEIFFESILKCPKGKTLRDAIRGYIPNSFVGIFQFNNMPTQPYTEIMTLIKTALFGTSCPERYLI